MPKMKKAAHHFFDERPFCEATFAHKKSGQMLPAFYCAYLNFLFLAASDFFLRFTLGFS